MMNTISTGRFTQLLYDMERLDGESAFILRKKGRIEESDVIYADRAIDRKTAARLLHIYIRDEIGEKDEADITPATSLKDLYDCRVCAGHIAQVYIKGIMEPAKLDEVYIFDGNGLVDEKEAYTYIERVKDRREKKNEQR